GWFAIREHEWRDEPVPLPLGAVVAVARITECLPMVDYEGDWPEPLDRNCPPGVLAIDDRPLSRDDIMLYRPGDVTLSGKPGVKRLWCRERTFHDERPYGDFRPGRYGLLLDH